MLRLCPKQAKAIVVLVVLVSNAREAKRAEHTSKRYDASTSKRLSFAQLARNAWTRMCQRGLYT